MKFKKYTSWSLPLIFGAVALFSAWTEHKPVQTQTKPKTTKINIPDLKYKIDTVNINSSKEFGKKANGAFFIKSNTIQLSYFVADTNDRRVIDCCNLNNSYHKFTLRHEREHARKAILTRKTENYTPYVRAQIAAFNEIMAPAAEIVEGIEYCIENNNNMPQAKKFVIDACQEIIAYKQNTKTFSGILFYDSAVSDIIIKYATKDFLSSVERGFYVNTIAKAYKNKPIDYTPNKECYKFNRCFFLPQLNMWDPLWEFETKNGPINPWRSASEKTRQETINTVNKLVCETLAKHKITLSQLHTR